MKIAMIGKIAGVLALTVGLAGCIDMTQDIYVTSADSAKATVTTTMAADIYAMIKSQGESAEEPFCADAGSTLTENADGSATCVLVSEGKFDELKFDEDEGSSKPVFTTNADGTVRIAVPTKDMVGDLGADSDPETAAMMKQLFEGHFLTIRFGGAEIVESNMDAAADDSHYVETKIPFLSLMDGTAKLPEELYAVVKP